MFDLVERASAAFSLEYVVLSEVWVDGAVDLSVLGEPAPASAPNAGMHTARKHSSKIDRMGFRSLAEVSKLTMSGARPSIASTSTAAETVPELKFVTTLATTL